MTTFHYARFKLTAWYLLIIMSLSIIFSVLIFKAWTIEINRFERAQRFFIERRLQEGSLPVPPPDGRRVHLLSGDQMNPALIAETKQRILLILIAANAGILAVTGGLGYFLAGRTLNPIKEMIDEQNRFITDASHELKTPLTALRSEFEVAILDEKKLQLKEAKHLIKSGFEEIVNLQALAENLLELTQHQKKLNSLGMENASLLEVIETALRRIVPLARKRQIAINNQVDDIILAGETLSLTELFIILLDNAIKYSDSNSEVTLMSRKADHHVEVVVKDTGSGIDEKDIPHIFDRFYRVDKSRSKTPGYGLGLSIAKKIVEAHKGTISVESKTNKGTKFIIKLPISTSRI